MPIAYVDPRRCDPSQCADGRCRVRKVCPTRAIQQFEPFDVPVADTRRCHACSKCVADCPARAIRLT